MAWRTALTFLIAAGFIDSLIIRSYQRAHPLKLSSLSLTSPSLFESFSLIYHSIHAPIFKENCVFDSVKDMNLILPDIFLLKNQISLPFISTSFNSEFSANLVVKAASKAFDGGVAGASASAVQVLSLMWLR